MADQFPSPTSPANPLQRQQMRKVGVAPHDGFAGTGAPLLQYTLDDAARGIDRARTFHPPTVTTRAALDWCVSCGVPEQLCGGHYKSPAQAVRDAQNKTPGAPAVRKQGVPFKDWK